MSEQRARDEARQSIEDGDFISGLAERLGSAARVDAVFGDPVERDGVTVIPVAKVSWGFGGGEGGEGEQEGHGGGGGAMAGAQGFIEIEGGHARYRPIRSPLRSGSLLLVALASVAALAALLVSASRD
jgi:hypothetical protein